MAMIAFEDSKGRVWRVWNVSPQDFQKRDYLATAYKGGWLCFEAEDNGERRRLADVPELWHQLAPARLELLCKVAEVVGRRDPSRSGTTPPSGITPVDGVTLVGGAPGEEHPGGH